MNWLNTQCPRWYCYSCSSRTTIVVAETTAVITNTVAVATTTVLSQRPLQLLQFFKQQRLLYLPWQASLLLDIV